jgi:hypothetical protein
MKHNPIAKPTSKDLSRLWLKVIMRGPDDCWEWRGCKGGGGYGQFGLNGKSHGAHRVVYRVYYGVDPGELDVCHTCDNPGCCNPEHLFLGTHTDNMRDCVKKGRNPKTRGARHHKAKLTDENVCEIRASNETGVALATKFGVSFPAISYHRNKDRSVRTDGLPYNNTSGVCGVHKKRGKWLAQFRFKKKAYYVGTFDTIAEAEQALITKRIELGIPMKEPAC